MRTVHFIWTHPLNQRTRLAALARYIRWQIGSRLVPGPVVLDWISGTRLLIKPGQHGATGCLYCGLAEFSEMAFVLHVLRPKDRFLDVGANVGVYTILASGAVGAHTCAFDPVPDTYEWLGRNVALNGISDRVETHLRCVGDHSGTVQITCTRDAVNHVLSPTEAGKSGIEARIETLDAMLAGRTATLIKIDVEGYETPVIEGATKLLDSNDLLGLILETNGSGARYGFDESKLHTKLLRLGFLPFTYSPFDRRLHATEDVHPQPGNTLYLRRLEEIEKRLSSAPIYTVHGIEF